MIFIIFSIYSEYEHLLKFKWLEYHVLLVDVGAKEVFWDVGNEVGNWFEKGNPGGIIPGGYNEDSPGLNWGPPNKDDGIMPNGGPGIRDDGATPDSWSLFDFARRFWNHILTWHSDKFKEAENSDLSAIVRYCFSRNFISNELSWWVVNGVLGFLFGLCFFNPIFKGPLAGIVAGSR